MSHFDPDLEMTPAEDRQKTRFTVTWQNLVQTVVLLSAMLFGYTDTRSDVRNNTTRIDQHDRDIDEMRITQQHNQDENGRLLREVNSKVDQIVGRLVQH